MEKNNDRKAPKVGEGKSKKENKIKEFYKNHKWAKPVTIVLVAILIFIIAMYSTIAVLNGTRPEQVEIPNVSGVNGAERIDKYIPQKIKESGKVEDFIIQCVEEHNKRERLKQERNAR